MGVARGCATGTYAKAKHPQRRLLAPSPRILVVESSWPGNEFAYVCTFIRATFFGCYWWILTSNWPFSYCLKRLSVFCWVKPSTCAPSHCSCADLPQRVYHPTCLNWMHLRWCKCGLSGTADRRLDKRILPPSTDQRWRF